MILNRRQRLVVSLLVLLATSVAVMTLAFFNSTDVVTNKVTSKEPPKILLSEPEWYAKGKELAEHYVPDVEIPKDPYVTNLSEYDVYVRMKVDILGMDGNPITDEAQLKAIMERIYVDGNKTKLLSESGVCNNKSFYYSDGYYYYGNSKELTPVVPKGSTERLFKLVATPNNEDTIVDETSGDKTFTYDVYFSQGFSIEVSAEAVYVLSEQEETFEETVERFERTFS